MSADLPPGKKLADHKLAMRQRGSMVNCYWVPFDTPDDQFTDAELVLAIDRNVIESAPELGEAFKFIAQALSMELLRQRRGYKGGFHEVVMLQPKKS